MSEPAVMPSPALHFRCNKVTHEEKRTNHYGEIEEVLEQFVQVQFSCIEAEQTQRGPQPYAEAMHGYIGLTLPIAVFRKLGYEVGRVYELALT